MCKCVYVYFWYVYKYIFFLKINLCSHSSYSEYSWLNNLGAYTRSSFDATILLARFSFSYFDDALHCPWPQPLKDIIAFLVNRPHWYGNFFSKQWRHKREFANCIDGFMIGNLAHLLNGNTEEMSAAEKNVTFYWRWALEDERKKREAENCVAKSEF